MKPGDVCEIEINGIGTLRNSIILGNLWGFSTQKQNYSE